MLTLEDKINVQLIKKFITEKKTTFPLLSIINQDWNKVETEKVDKLLTNIPSDNITELKELIYPGTK